MSARHISTIPTTPVLYHNALNYNILCIMLVLMLYVYIYIYIYICIYVYIYIYTYNTYIHIYIYIYTHRGIFESQHSCDAPSSVLTYVPLDMLLHRTTAWIIVLIVIVIIIITTMIIIIATVINNNSRSRAWAQDQTGLCSSWLRTTGVNTNGAAAKVINFDRLGKKVHPGTLRKITVGKREYPKSPSVKHKT